MILKKGRLQRGRKVYGVGFWERRGCCAVAERIDDEDAAATAVRTAKLGEQRAGGEETREEGEEIAHASETADWWLWRQAEEIINLEKGDEWKRRRRQRSRRARATRPLCLPALLGLRCRPMEPSEGVALLWVAVPSTQEIKRELTRVSINRPGSLSSQTFSRGSLIPLDIPLKPHRGEISCCCCCCSDRFRLSARDNGDAEERRNGGDRGDRTSRRGSFRVLLVHSTAQRDP